MDPIFAMTLAEALAAIVLITLQLTIAHPSGLQVEFIVASFLDQASLHPLEEIWSQKPRRKPPDKTRANASRGFSTHLIANVTRDRQCPGADKSEVQGDVLLTIAMHIWKPITAAAEPAMARRLKFCHIQK